VECREAAQHIPAYVDQSGGPAARALDAHLRTCEHCRSELDAYRDLQGALAALATQTIEPPAWLLPATIESVRARASLRRRLPVREVGKRLADPRLAAAGGAAILLAGLATGAVLIRGRRRRRRLVGSLRAAAVHA
jgi:predicted anti-sigma-YlaC factor YlaD